MASRVTLIRSVLNTIPTHTMSTILLSSSTCHQIDKICRDFVWGSYDGGKHIHLALWSKVLTAKYKVGYGNIQETVRAKKASSTGWKSILRGLKEVVLPGLKWNVFTGQNIRFWSDSWVLTTPLADHALQQIPDDAFNVKVNEMWSLDDGWKWEGLDNKPPRHILLQIASLSLATDGPITTPRVRPSQRTGSSLPPQPMFELLPGEALWEHLETSYPKKDQDIPLAMRKTQTAHEPREMPKTYERQSEL
ncbi:hypothetical protein V2J09_005063 [Rumex salicifolius]